MIIEHVFLALKAANESKYLFKRNFFFSTKAALFVDCIVVVKTTLALNILIRRET